MCVSDISPFFFPHRLLRGSNGAAVLSGCECLCSDHSLSEHQLTAIEPTYRAPDLKAGQIPTSFERQL